MVRRLYLWGYEACRTSAVSCPFRSVPPFPLTNSYLLWTLAYPLCPRIPVLALLNSADDAEDTDCGAVVEEIVVPIAPSVGVRHLRQSVSACGASLDCGVGMQSVKVTRSQSNKRWANDYMNPEQREVLCSAAVVSGAVLCAVLC